MLKNNLIDNEIPNDLVSFAQSDTPGWFLKAIKTPWEDKYIEVDDCTIHYQHWQNKGDKPGLLFVHGGGAHSHWWDFIIPSFLNEYDIAAIDLSGMGDSGHRDEYASLQHAKELIAVIDDAGLQNTIIVAHSYGGLGALNAGLAFSERLKGIVVADTMIMMPPFSPENAPFKAKKMYPDLDSALEKFRLVPPQTCDNTFLINYIAAHSVKHDNNDWFWKFDAEFAQKTNLGELQENIKHIKTKIIGMYGENSILFSPSLLDMVKEYYDKSVPFYSLPNAGHHLFLDQPLEFIDLIKYVLNIFDE